MIEGSGAGSVPLANGSGFGFWRPKNIQILRIRILIPDTCRKMQINGGVGEVGEAISQVAAAAGRPRQKKWLCRAGCNSTRNFLPDPESDPE